MPLSLSLQNILSHAFQAPLYTYPTALTQGIVSKPLHSHNDYWRPIPFYSALSFGCQSIEADVWFYNNTLHVGHEPASLTAERTLDALYIQPVLSVLRGQNPQTDFTVPKNKSARKNGVYDTSPSQTLYLFIDMKTSGPPTYAAVHTALHPLREEGYLTTYHPSNSTFRPGAITVIGTGNTPLTPILSAETRDIFYDASLIALPEDKDITPDLSPIASTSFKVDFGDVKAPLSGKQERLLRQRVAAAHERGILVRYWDLPEWPLGLRDLVWGTLWDAGVDFLNVDDLEAGAKWWGLFGDGVRGEGGEETRMGRRDEL